MNKLSFFIALLFIGITSCKKAEIPSSPPYIEQWWEDYYGLYDVTDTLNETVYELKISQISRSFDGTYFEDSILVENFANQFDLRITSPQIYYTDLSVGNHFGIKDENGHRWAVSGKHYWNENKDSLFIRYTQSNIAFYAEDGVDFYEVINTDLAVKK